MKKLYALMLISMLVLLNFASAYSVSFSNEDGDTSGRPMDNWLGRLFSSLKGDTLFTTYGQELECSTYPVEQVVFSADVPQSWLEEIIIPNFLFQKASTVNFETNDQETVFVNFFRGVPEVGYYADHPGDSWQLVDEVYLGYLSEIRNSYSFTCDAGAYWDNLCYYEVYTCPNANNLLCYSNFDCQEGESCFLEPFEDLSTGGTDSDEALGFPAGVGKCLDTEGGLLTHITKIYECDGDERVLLDAVTQGTTGFCTNPNDFNYILSGSPTGICSDDKNFCGGIAEDTITGTIENLKKIGEVCDKDIDCESTYCGAGGLLKDKKCEPLPWNRIKKLSLTEEELSTITTTEALGIACETNSECIVTDEEKYDAKCISLQKLIDDETVSFGKESFFDKSKEVIGNVAGGVIIGGFLGYILCGTAGGLTAVTAGGAAPAALIVCSAAITGGAVAGGALAYSVTSFSSGDSIVKKLKAGDADAVGLCVAEKKGVGLDKIFGWAAFFPITGDDGTDGLIIIGGVIVILYFLGGRRRKF